MERSSWLMVHRLAHEGREYQVQMEEALAVEDFEAAALWHERRRAVRQRIQNMMTHLVERHPHVRPLARQVMATGARAVPVAPPMFRQPDLPHPLWDYELDG